MQEACEIVYSGRKRQGGADVSSNRLLASKPTDPIKLLEELDAYLSFRLCCDAPSIPHDEILAIKKSIRAALDANNDSATPVV